MLSNFFQCCLFFITLSATPETKIWVKAWVILILPGVISDWSYLNTSPQFVCFHQKNSFLSFPPVVTAGKSVFRTYENTLVLVRLKNHLIPKDLLSKNWSFFQNRLVSVKHIYFCNFKFVQFYSEWKRFIESWRPISISLWNQACAVSTELYTTRQESVAARWRSWLIFVLWLCLHIF